MNKIAFIVILLLILPIVVAQNETNETQEELTFVRFRILGIIPDSINIGDAQINIQVQNTGNIEAKDIFAIITGEGISTYEIIPIDELQSFSKSYIIAKINAKKSGVIALKVKVSDQTQQFNLTVTDPNAGKEVESEEEKQAKLESQKSELREIIAQHYANYEKYAEQYEQRKRLGFIVDNVDISTAKQQLISAQSALARDDIRGADAAIAVVETELDDIKKELEQTYVPKKTWSDLAKENIVIIAAIFTALVGFITLYEILKNKVKGEK